MMKYNFSYRDSYEWIHVICAWWVPEVKIEDVKFIERIRKDKIPVSLEDLVNFILFYILSIDYFQKLVSSSTIGRKYSDDYGLWYVIMKYLLFFYLIGFFSILRQVVGIYFALYVETKLELVFNAQ